MQRIQLLWGFVIAIAVFAFLGYLVIIKQQDQLLNPPTWEPEWKMMLNLEILPEGDYGRLIDMKYFEFLRDHQGCHQLENRPKIVIMIHSAPANFAKRKTIRESWGYKDRRSLLLFVIGAFDDKKIELKIAKEAVVHDDILQGNFVDTYRNITYKHTSALKWFVYNCPDAKFLVKADDDAFINTPLLYNFLDEPSKYSVEFHQGNLLFCNSYTNMPIIRDNQSKWYVSPDEYPGQYYPPYCPGFTLIFSIDVAFELYRAVQAIPYFWVDDVHITGTARLKAKIPFSPTNGLVLYAEQRKNILDGKIEIKDLPFLFGYFNLGDRDMRKLWKMVECSNSKKKLYCQVNKWFKELGRE